jgi:hypothetical protein
MQKIISSSKKFILSSNLPPLRLCFPGWLHHFPPTMSVIQTEQNILLSPAAWWRRYNHFSQCSGFRKFLWWTLCKILVRRWFYTIIQTFKSWIRVESLTHCLFCHPAPQVSSMASYSGTLFYHCLLIYYQKFLCRCSKNL